MTDDVENRAAQWVVNEDSSAWTAADEAALDNWLNESTLNRVAYLRLRSAWKRADRLAALRMAPVVPTRTYRGSLLLAASLVAAAIVAVASLYALWPRNVYETPVGGRRTIDLADGSVMELNTNTRVHTEVTDRERKVVLEQGEAYFQVVHDASRPFVVLAANRRITDLGTKFSVRRDGDRVEVTVSEGHVRVDNMDRPRVSPPVLAQRDVQVLASANSTLVTERTPTEIGDALGWRRGILIFHQEALGDAIAEFNRYNTKKLVVVGKSLSQTRIGGSFEASNIEAFARLLRDGFGFRVEETDSEVRISE